LELASNSEDGLVLSIAAVSQAAARQVWVFSAFDDAWKKEKITKHFTHETEMRLR
jgi:exo-beta-1,3-glucanase (GH17 family)